MPIRATKKVKWVLKMFLWWLLVLLFLYGIGVTFIFQEIHFRLNPKTSVTHFELPLASINGLAVDGQGNIYVGSTDYSCIQVYSPQGRYIRGLHMGANVGGGDFIFHIDQQDQLMVFGYRGNVLCIFDANGLIEHHPSIASAPFQSTLLSGVMDDNGNSYKVGAWSWCVPRIIRTDPSGKSKVVVSQPWYIWIIKSPFPTFFVSFLSIVGLWIFRGPMFRRR